MMQMHIAQRERFYASGTAFIQWAAALSLSGKEEGGGAGLFESVASYAKAGFIVHAQPQACLDHDDTAP